MMRMMMVMMVSYAGLSQKYSYYISLASILVCWETPYVEGQLIRKSTTGTIASSDTGIHQQPQFPEAIFQ